MGLGGLRHDPAALPPGKRPGTHCIGGWVGPRAGLDGGGKSRLYLGSIPGPSSPVASRYTDWSIPAHPQEEFQFEIYLMIFYQLYRSTVASIEEMTPFSVNKWQELIVVCLVGPYHIFVDGPGKIHVNIGSIQPIFGVKWVGCPLKYEAMLCTAPRRSVWNV